MRQIFTTLKELKPFIALLGHHRKWMVLGTFMGLTAVSAAVGLLSLAGWFLSATAIAALSVSGAQLFNFFFPSIGVRLFAFGRTLARYAERIVSHDATFRILQSLRVWFYRKIEPLSPGCLGKYRSGDILNRMVEDIDTLDNLYLRVLSPTVVALFLSFILLVFLWAFDGTIAATGFAFLITAGFLVPVIAGKLAGKTGEKLAELSAELRFRIVETLQGMSELLVFGSDESHLGTMRQTNEKLIACQFRMSQVTGFTAFLTTLVTGLAVLTVLFVGIEKVATGSIGGATLALAALAVMAAFEAVAPLPSAFQYLGRTRKAGNRLLEIVNTEPVVSFPPETSEAPNRFGVRFEDVGFYYHDLNPPVLENATFRIANGQRVVVLGETGSGKTTLVNLLVRFWKPDTGRIFIGDCDIGNLEETDLRRYVTVVSQQPHIFSASVRENLMIARGDASEHDLSEALRAAQLLNFVNRLPHGMDTWVGESGRLLSGGQAKRLAMARAFLHNGLIWVLDEPTEGLDRVTEKRLLEAVFDHTRGKTLMMITHRPIGLKNMDKVIWLQSGNKVVQGTHETLLMNNAEYANLYTGR